MKAFGLDFSEGSLKAIVLTKKAKQTKLVNFFDFPLEEGIIVKGRIVKEEALSVAIKDALKAAKKGALKDRFVVSCMPEAESFIRIIKLPNLPEDELSAAVRWEFEQHIPLALNEVYFDWQKAGKQGSDLEVFVAAAPRKLVESYTQAIKAAGLIPLAIETESIATARSLVRENDPDCYLIVDIGYSRTSLVIYDHGMLQFASSVEPYSQSFSEKLASDLKLNLQEAESLKRMYGLNHEARGISQKVYRSLRPLVEKLAQEISTALKFYNDHFPQGQSLQRVMLCGGGAKLKGLVPALKIILKEDVVLGDPWVNIWSTQGKYLPEISRKDSLSYATAIGLALRGLAGF